MKFLGWISGSLVWQLPKVWTGRDNLENPHIFCSALEHLKGEKECLADYFFKSSGRWYLDATFFHCSFLRFLSKMTLKPQLQWLQFIKLLRGRKSKPAIPLTIKIVLFLHTTFFRTTIKQETFHQLLLFPELQLMVELTAGVLATFSVPSPCM